MARFTLVAGLLIAAFTMVVGPAAAQHLHGPFGLGIILGEPTGIDGKLFLAGGNAIEGAVAWSFDSDRLHLQGEYVYHWYDPIKVEKGQMPIFVGVGGRIIFRKGDDSIGVRVPVGLAYEFDGAPLDVFGEIVPILDLAPDTDFDLEGAIGARFYF